jgi:NitT/TauT family transport system substrate-binding protein
MGAALRRGDVDAAVSYPPPSTGIVTAGWARPIFTSGEIPGEILDVLAFDESVLASHGRDVAAFLRAYDEAVSWMAGHRDEACRIMAAPERSTPAAFGASLDDGLELVSASQQDAYFCAGGRLPRAVDATSRLMMMTGQITTPIPATDVLAAPGSR